MRHFRCHAWFDGERLRDDPVVITVDHGTIVALGSASVPDDGVIDAGFAMPGLVEAHAHLFLDGDELDAGRRAAHLERMPAELVAMGVSNLDRLLQAGITLVRDAGDRHGVNLAVRAESGRRLAHGIAAPRVRAAGPAIRKRGRYGSFMAVDMRDIGDAAKTVADLPVGVDDCKLLATGVIDFAAGAVKGAPQFTDEELALLVEAATARGLPVLAHCSGEEGLRRVVNAGVGSVEHGFFMPADLLPELARRGTCWVGTWAPVAFMRDHPDIAGLDAAAVAGLTRILDHHLAMTALAHRLGVRLVAGSDAGSWGVPFGAGLHRELAFLAAAGLPLAAILHAATLAPRRAWGLPSGRIAVGAPADLVFYGPDTAISLAALTQPDLVMVAGVLWRRPRSGLVPGNALGASAAVPG